MTVMRAKLILIASLTLSASAMAQSSPEVKLRGDEDAVIINLDALTPPPEPEVQKAPRPRVNAGRTIPLPRPKPLSEQAGAALAEPVAAPPPAPLEQQAKPAPPTPPLRTGFDPGRPSAPVTIVENFPVEISGVASDPNASGQAFNPIAGFVVISRVRFATGTSGLPDNALASLDETAMRLLATSDRVRIAAYSGKRTDYSSDARRLSLERARAVRSYLVSRGVAVERMDVLPFGGAPDGVTDRVDVMASGP